MPSNPSETLRKILGIALSKHGATAEFCRKTGFARNTVENWLRGISAPNTDNLAEIAKYLGIQPWELLKPDFAVPTPKPEVPTTTEQLIAKTVRETLKQIEARSLGSDEDASAVLERLSKGFEEFKQKETPTAKLLEELLERLKIMNVAQLQRLLEVTKPMYEAALARNAEKDNDGKNGKKEVG